MPDYPQRKSPRLPDYDYSQMGAYFVTICTHNRQHLFGEIVVDEMYLNQFGQIANDCWLKLPAHFANITINHHVVMPNHVHAIIEINHQTKIALGTMVGTYKAAITRQLGRIADRELGIIWQERFHDHIIRNEADMHRIQEYIQYNPALWEKDTFYDDLEG